ncbi:MAG TPA: 2-dehydropantoate 2-reductase [Acidimicrobiales bacterium]
MRWIIYGAGAVGGVVGARLQLSGQDVTFIARGAHAEAMKRSGLRLDDPVESVNLAADVVTDPAQAGIGEGDVVLLAMKSQDTRAALEKLERSAPSATSVVCLQNGVENEREALRRFPNVYAVCVMLPTTHLEPGVVEAYSTPVPGILDTGRYPAGADDTARNVASGFSGAGFVSEARPDIMRWKHAKLLMNLGNALEALCGSTARLGPIAARLREEGEACLRAAGIDFVSTEEDAARRGDLIQIRPIDGRRRGGGSTWQSFQRGTGSIETDYLNGEIVLLGRRHGVPTPANELLQRLAHQAVAQSRAPGSMSIEELEHLLEKTQLSAEPGGS